ncbi:Vacuolar protein-sorting-associated protein 36 [Dimargaris verticillata]|uniref:Vacuolar protein-sorting-associated protein 36 n=1 Tax=Dimargaris verticillata TaxID=2761393 RepID=A0A9W8B8F0_9FUNG|nr:Vacuolar protein-sorting-associated protein 36 [Dimargaris verticillata]
MNRFDHLELSLSLRPALRDLEPILLIQNHVGLYDGNKKDLKHNDGNLYLTPLRILYVDAQHPRQRSLSLELVCVKKCSTQAGFLTSSPKIILELRPRSPSPATVPPRHASPPVAASPSRIPVANWQCNICNSYNVPTAKKCALCGVNCPPGAASKTVYARPVGDPGQSHAESFSAAGSSADTACPACTFVNHPAMVRCELCDTLLKPSTHPSPASTPVSPSASATRTNASDSQPGMVKLSFRNGGCTTFHTALLDALDAEAWASDTSQTRSASLSTGAGSPTQSRYPPQNIKSNEPGHATPQSATRTSDQTNQGFQSSMGGISHIMRRVDQTHRATEDTLSDAFQDLNALRTKATQMVQLAQVLMEKSARQQQQQQQQASRVVQSPTSSTDENNFKLWLTTLGIESPVTRDSAGAVYHQELAKELEEFLENVLPRVGGIMTLVDVYCVFNRARGVALVSPEDIANACRLFEPQGLSLRLRKFPSGLVAVQSSDLSDDVMARRFNQYLRGFGAMSALELASYEQMAVPLLNELLLAVEARGEICRDESLEGVKFYPNRIQEEARQLTQSR